MWEWLARHSTRRPDGPGRGNGDVAHEEEREELGEAAAPANGGTDRRGGECARAVMVHQGLCAGQAEGAAALLDKSRSAVAVPEHRKCRPGPQPSIARPAKTHRDTVFICGHFGVAVRWAAMATETASDSGVGSGITGSFTRVTRVMVKYPRTSSDLRRRRRVQPQTVPSDNPRYAAT